MIYVLDTNSLSNILNHYYPGTFRSFWKRLQQGIREGRLASVRECEGELGEKFTDIDINRLAAHNAEFFAKPSPEELEFMTRIYSIPHFQQNLKRKKLLEGGYFADPFVIAKAAVLGGVVVTEEQQRENAAKIPNICKHFGVGCVSLEDFLSREGWIF